MADAITRRNEKARERAQTAGRVTYHREVVDVWPACVVCGEPIRHRGDRSMYRRCGCNGVGWYWDSTGIRRTED